MFGTNPFAWAYFAEGYAGQTTVTDHITPALAGAGSLSATVTPYQRITVGLSGAGSLSANVTELHRITASLSGAGALAASLTEFVYVGPALAGRGSLAATLTPYQRFVASLSGAGSLQATLTPYQQFLASLAGAGSLTATVTPYQRITVALNGSGALTAQVTPYMRITPALAGSGALSAQLTALHQFTAALAGQGSLAAAVSALLSFTTDLSGRGALTALVTTGVSVPGGGYIIDLPATGGDISDRAVYAGLTSDRGPDGGYVMDRGAACIGEILDYAPFAGFISDHAGSLTPSPVTRLISPALGGAGALAAIIPGHRVVAPTLAGAGALLASLSRYRHISPHLAGAGTIDAAVTTAPEFFPPPPASYTPTGTITTLHLDDQTGDGPGLGQATFHPNWNHIVQTASGDIFAAYNYYDSENGTGEEHTVTHYRVKWIAPPYTSAVTIYDSNVAGQIELDYGMGPHLEADADGNVYVLTNHYPRSGSSSSVHETTIQKFSAPYSQTYTSVGTTIGTIPQASNKWSACYDQTRQLIVECFWQDTTAANLYATDLDGNIVYSKNIFNPKPGVELYATATYPCVTVANDGTWIIAWSAESSELIQPTPTESFYDDRFVYTEDGIVFTGPNGTITLPVYADNSTADPAKLAYSLTNPGVDFIDGTDPSYGSGVGEQYGWNHLQSLAFNNGALFAVYESESSSPQVFGGVHMPLVRFDWASKTVDYRREPVFNSDADYHLSPGNTGSFAQDTTQAARLYFCSQGRADQGNLGKLAVLRSDAPDATVPEWDLYAEGANIGTANGLINICAGRYVNEDGSINIICEQADAPYGIYLGRVEPA